MKHVANKVLFQVTLAERGRQSGHGVLLSSLKFIRNLKLMTAMGYRTLKLCTPPPPMHIQILKRAFRVWWGNNCINKRKKVMKLINFLYPVLKRQTKTINGASIS